MCPMTRKSNLSLSTMVSDDRQSRLQVLAEFMRTLGDSGAEVARILGITRGAVAQWFRSDDVKLSYCSTYMAAKGYDLILTLTEKVVKTDSDSVSIVIERKMPEVESGDCVRLAFLQVAMAKHGITKLDIAKALDVKYNTVRHWFVVDDVYMSHVFDIADKFKFKLNFMIKPKD